MSKQANPTLIGAFVLGAIALGVIGILFFGSTHLFVDEEEFVIFFDETVNGLDVGAPVKFKGVPVGQVTAIYIRLDDRKDIASIPVIISISKKTLGSELVGDGKHLIGGALYESSIKKGLRAKLEYQSFVTGMLFIELNYYPDESVPHLRPNSFNLKEIPAVSSGLNELWKKASEAIMDISSIDFKSMGNRLNDILVKVDKGVSEINFEDINGAFAEIQKVGAQISHKVDPLSESLTETLYSAQSAFDRIQHSFDNVDNMLSPDSTFRYEVENAFQEFAEASQAVRELADYLERNPSSIITGKDYSEVDQ